MPSTIFDADHLLRLEAATTRFRDFCIARIPGEPNKGAGVISYMTDHPETPAKIRARAFQTLGKPPLSNHSELEFAPLREDLAEVFLEIHDKVSARAPVLASRFLPWNMVISRRGPEVHLHMSIGPYALTEWLRSDSGISAHEPAGVLEGLEQVGETLRALPPKVRSFPVARRHIYASSWADALLIDHVLSGKTETQASL